MTAQNSKLNLMLAAGDSYVSPDDSRMLETPEARGARHMPIAHRTMFDIVMDSIKNHDIKVVDYAIALSQCGGNMFSLFEVSTGTDGYSGVMAARFSHIQKFAASLASGNGVWACSNLCLGGEHIIKTRHTLNIMERLPAEVSKAVSRAHIQAQDSVTDFNQYKETKLVEATAYKHICHMIHNGVIPGKVAARFIAEYLEPSYDEHAADGWNVYRLFNAATEVLKPETEGRSIIPALYARSMKVKQYCDTVARIKKRDYSDIVSDQ